VARLTETRADAVDTQAAELRRIERDLHDGAQARLVAMGMNLGAAEALLDQHPEAARALLVEARESSAKALTELRELVRGIHPPVLADRGLGDAVRALALDSPLQVAVTVDLPGRLEPAVESAAYFAVSELLTNVAKHAHAQTVRVDLWYGTGRLRVTCTDDGRGGAGAAAADLAAGRGQGSGLAGIERRIGTFDGVMAVRSPAGGPTEVTLEIPCASSSAKTSTF
jgi:signal transduction histidine kinase